MTFARLKFLISRLPRIIQIAKELWLLLGSTEQDNLDQYLVDLESTVKGFRGANEPNERHEAGRRLSDLISRL